MALYEVLTRTIQTKKRLAAVTLRELEPKTHAVINSKVKLPKGSLLREVTGTTWCVRETNDVDAVMLLEGPPGRLPGGNYLEDVKT